MSSPSKQTQIDSYGTIHSNDSGSDNDSRSDSGGRGSPLVYGTNYNGAHNHAVSTYDLARRSSFIEENEDPLQIDVPTRGEKKDVPVTWMSLPSKRQLLILAVSDIAKISFPSAMSQVYWNSLNIRFKILTPCRPPDFQNLLFSLL